MSPATGEEGEGDEGVEKVEECACGGVVLETVGEAFVDRGLRSLDELGRCGSDCAVAAAILPPSP